jgi:hypothetical protein
LVFFSFITECLFWSSLLCLENVLINSRKKSHNNLKGKLCHLFMKEGSLFCNHQIHQTRMLQIVFLVSLESSWQGGVHGLGPMTFGLVAQKFLNIEWFSSLKMKLNHSWKFRKNWYVSLVLLERSWWAGFNGIYLVRFGFRMWEILIFKWFLSLKIQINSKKPGFGSKNQLRTS